MNPKPSEMKEYQTIKNIIVDVCNSNDFRRDVKLRCMYAAAVKFCKKTTLKTFANEVVFCGQNQPRRWIKRHNYLMQNNDEYAQNYGIVRYRIDKALHEIHHDEVTPDMITEYYRLKNLIEPHNYRTITPPDKCEIKSHKACKCGDHCMYGKKRNLNEI